MNILIDIGHPAHVHLFKNTVLDMQKRGHDFFFTVREGENETKLLDKYGFKYQKIGDKRVGGIKKFFGIFSFSWKIIRIARKFKPDIFLSHGSMYAGYAAFFLRKPHIALEDSGNMEQIRLYRPFANAILTPDVLKVDLGKKQIKYLGYHEIAYLHPKYFTPDPREVLFSGIDVNSPYCIIRFVSWNATHDINMKGFSADQKIDIIRRLSKKFKIYISSEGELPEELVNYKLNIPPEKIHHFLAFAEFCISEGATIASESGLLGTPAIYMNPLVRYYNEDQEKYGTLYNFRTPAGVIEKALEILGDPQRKSKFAANRDNLLKQKIDVTSFLVWFIEEWPESFSIMKNDPEFQLKFRNI